MSDLRIGLAGYGERGHALLVNAHRPGRGSQIVAVADPKPEALARAAQAAGPDVRYVADLNDLFANEVDAVVVATPDALHEEHAVAALERGCAVYLEKPIAITTHGADRILAAAVTGRALLYAGHNMRHMSFVGRMKELIDEGAIGDVKVILCRHFVGHGGSYYFQRWHADRRNSTSLLLQKGAHDIDIIHWLGGAFSHDVNAFGELMVYRNDRDRQQVPGEDPPWFVSEGSASLSVWPPTAMSRLNPVVDVEDVSIMQMRLDNGVLASYQQCHFTPDYWRNYVVIGTGGRLENFGNGEPGSTVGVWNRRRNGWRSEPDVVFDTATIATGHGGADATMMEEFVASLRRGLAPSTNPVAARYSVAAACAATESMRNGGLPMAVPPVDREIQLALAFEPALSEVHGA